MLRGLQKHAPSRRISCQASAEHVEQFAEFPLSGKTLAGGMECAMHATGCYPEWWQGKHVDNPTGGWIAGTTDESARDTAQLFTRAALWGRLGRDGRGHCAVGC